MLDCENSQKTSVFTKDQVPFDSGLFCDDFIFAVKDLSEVSQLEVKKISNTYANNFVLNHHYLKRKLYIARNVSYGIFFNGYCIGVCMFGFPVWNKYPGLVPPMKSAEVPELLRLCTLSCSPKNGESYFIAKCLKMLKQDWFDEVGVYPKAVTSLCDLAFGFNGSIYKATNFELLKITEGRATNPGGTHGKWKKNTDTQKAEKAMYVKFLCKKAKFDL
jgi:hypothetical protein